MYWLQLVTNFYIFSFHFSFSALEIFSTVCFLYFHSAYLFQLVYLFLTFSVVILILVILCAFVNFITFFKYVYLTEMYLYLILIILFLSNFCFSSNIYFILFHVSFNSMNEND